MRNLANFVIKYKKMKEFPELCMQKVSVALHLQFYRLSPPHKSRVLLACLSDLSFSTIFLLPVTRGPVICRPDSQLLFAHQ